MKLTSSLNAKPGKQISIKDSYVDFDYPSSLDEDMILMGVGKRYKGPVCLYKVGLYSSLMVKKSLSQFKWDDHKTAMAALESLAIGPSTATIVIKTTVKARAPQYVGKAIADSVATRFDGSVDDLIFLQELIAKGCEGRTTAKGTLFRLDCGLDGIAVSVNGKKQGHIWSEDISKAILGVYLDKNSVSPSLKANCVESCCGGDSSPRFSGQRQMR